MGESIMINDLSGAYAAVKKIYGTMSDTESKEIFINKLMFNITREPKYLERIILQNEAIRKMLDIINGKGRTAIFGAGANGRSLSRFITAEKCCFIDNYINGQSINGIPSVSLQEFLDKFDDGEMTIAVTPTRSYEEIIKQLSDSDISGSRVLSFGSITREMENSQYFDYFRPCPGKEEGFVDGGSLDGKTSERYAAWAGGKYGKIWAFEPDKANYELCGKRISLERFNLYDLGLYDRECTLSFSSGSSQYSRIDKNGIEKIGVIDLDTVLEGETVTFIKMDIEGSEYKALCGARKIITSQKPRLAISIYHKLEDITEIPGIILDMRSDYKFAMRHYSVMEAETVLYAY